MHMKLRRRANISNKKLMSILSVLLLVVMTVGFAYLEARVNIKGSVAINNNGKWNVHFENIVVKDGSVSTSNATMSSDKKKITFSAYLANKEDYYQFVTFVVNEGTIDAMVSSVQLSGIPDSLKEFVTYSLTYVNGNEIKENDVLPAGSIERVKVLLRFKDGAVISDLPIDDVNFKLTLEIPYVQANGDAVDRRTNSGGNSDLIQSLELYKKAEPDKDIVFIKNSSDTNGKGVYLYVGSEEDKYPIYYYRGAVNDNNVLFANYCWKMVRTTETGGMKLVYNGAPVNNQCTNTTEDSTQIATSPFNELSDSKAYVNYMYGDVYDVRHDVSQSVGYYYGQGVSWNGTQYTLKNTYYTKGYFNNEAETIESGKYFYTCMAKTTTCEEVYYITFATRSFTPFFITLNNGDTVESSIVKMMYGNDNSSTIKKVVDEWYENNLKDTEYEDYLDNPIYCSDVTPKITTYEFYNFRDRTYTNMEKPLVTCPSQGDSYTVKGKKHLTGNASLDYPIALLEADEAALAGYTWIDSSDYNTTNYLYNNKTFWLLSPSSHVNYTNVMVVYSRGSLNYSDIKTSNGIRPVISLAAKTAIKSGNGTAENPYTFYIKGKDEEPKAPVDNLNIIQLLNLEVSVRSDSRIDFTKYSSNLNGKGLYVYEGTENDKYPIYYYRGAVEDNNIIFAEKCWKIVRTTETGGTKLIYNGEPINNTCNNTGIDSQLPSETPFNSDRTNIENISYTSSMVKQTIDKWYEDNLATKYSSYLEDTIWCADNAAALISGIRNQGFVNRTSVNGQKPILTCSSKEDSYTLKSGNNSLGNKILDYPIALLNADEAMLAGLAWYNKNNSTYSRDSYLFNGQAYWLLNPNDVVSSSTAAALMIAYVRGDLESYYVNSGAGIRPSVSLKAGTKVTTSGTGKAGTADNPYIVE